MEELLTNARTNVIQCFFDNELGLYISAWVCQKVYMGWNYSIIKEWIWVCLQLGHFKSRGFDCHFLLTMGKTWVIPLPISFHITLKVACAPRILHYINHVLNDEQNRYPQGVTQNWSLATFSPISCEFSVRRTEQHGTHLSNGATNGGTKGRVQRCLGGCGATWGCSSGSWFFPSRLEYFASYDKPLIYHYVHI